jgi:signal transduction histidine kinase
MLWLEMMTLSLADGGKGAVRDRLVERLVLSSLVFSAWTIAGIFWGSERYFRLPAASQLQSAAWWPIVWPHLLRAYIWAAFTPLVVYLYRRFPIGQGRPVQNVLALTFASLLFPLPISILHSALYQLLVLGPPPATPFLERTLESTLFWFHFQLLAFWSVTGITWFVCEQRHLREKDREAARLEAEIHSMRLETLRAQIHPHFLFNALHAVLPLVKRDPDAAADTVIRLGDLLRASLRSDPLRVVPLASEIAILRAYLSIEKTRFGDLLSFDFEIEAGLEGFPLPELILQPLVENAIKHGIAKAPEGGSVRVIAERQEAGSVRVSVRNSGPGLCDVRPEGVGLGSVRSRLDLIYGQNASFQLRGSGQGVEASLILPHHGARPD